jgi:hypothetical protein
LSESFFLQVIEPAYRQVPIANELERRGLGVSVAGLRCVWQRQDLEKRLEALEAKSALEGLALSEIGHAHISGFNQISALGIRK